jgi:hypothetical protein
MVRGCIGSPEQCQVACGASSWLAYVCNTQCAAPSTGYRLEGLHEAPQLAASESAGGAADRQADGGTADTQQTTVLSPGHRFNQVRLG